MAKIQVMLSDEISNKLDLLRKFDKGTFVELAIKEALNNSDLVSRFIWKDSALVKEEIKTKENTSITKPKLKIDNDFS